jgi:hypothetical protein
MTDSRPSIAAGPSSRVPHWFLPAVFFLLLSILLVLPFSWLGTASGHDFEFHAANWFDVAYQWKQGTLYPRWTSWTNHGFGEPRFIFYPPLSWVLGAALTILLPGPAVPVVYIVLLQTFAGLCAYALLRNLASRRAAILGAAFYAINPNALLITYMRSDFAEQLACAFFPLLLLAALRLAGLLGDSHSRSSTVLFAVPFAAVWLSNAPAGVIASYSMALLFGCVALFERSWRPLLWGGGGLALGLGLTSFYLLPAAYEQRWVNIGQALSAGLVPVQNFLFTEGNDPEHTWFNWIASICAVSLMLVLGLTALASRRFSAVSTRSERQRATSMALLLLGTAASLLTLRVTVPLWTYLPKLRFVQFPWRAMSIIALVAAYFLALTVERPRGWLSFAVLLALSVPLAGFEVTNTWWDDDEMPTLRGAVTSGSGFDGTDEYDPLGDDHFDLPAEAPLVRILAPGDEEDSPAPKANVSILRWSPEHKEIRVDSATPGRVALRLLDYPAWRVELNGKRISPEHLDNSAQMVIPVEPGTSDIRVDFERTADRKLGLLLSTLSALLAAFLLASRRRKSDSRVSRNRLPAVD